VGKLGKISFRPGYYIYIGSALNNIYKRVSRHIVKSKKKFWHIDYLTSDRNFCVQKIYIINRPDRLECKKAGELGKFLDVIEGFGSSDCRCSGHLFYTGEEKSIIDIEKDIILKSGFEKYNIGWKLEKASA
jgi:Uri superfamily endonuclease